MSLLENQLTATATRLALFIVPLTIWYRPNSSPKHRKYRQIVDRLRWFSLWVAGPRPHPHPASYWSSATPGAPVRARARSRFDRHWLKHLPPTRPRLTRLLLSQLISSCFAAVWRWHHLRVRRPRSDWLCRWARGHLESIRWMVKTNFSESLFSFLVFI